MMSSFYEEMILSLKREPMQDLRRLQKMPFDWKLQHSKDVIIEFVERLGVDSVYVSFSGGKDSLVLLHLVRSLFPSVPAVFANTGIEFPQQVSFVRTFSNVIELHPIKHFPKILKEDGIVYPSKEVSMYVRDARKGVRYAVNGFKGLDKDGIKDYYRQRFKKWSFLLDLDVKISPVCCDFLKEIPLRNFEKKTGKFPFIGIRAQESMRRAIGWTKSGCNSLVKGRFKSTPLSLWTSLDVDEYIKLNSLEVSPMYSNSHLKRTGCMFCPVPIAHGDYRSIEFARKNYPKLFETIMFKFGLGKMLQILTGKLL